MATYRVKVMYIYSDTVEVEANSKEDAEFIAVQEAEEECDYLSEVIVNKIKGN